ncbi:hypothetical protein LMG23994_00312 [Cupriavidus pinatubonensis]|uniref:Uncharacterized protein n=1 Tax=Cupriavidus pinatubonensis TaxID=248026 RepID=A0ABM8W9G1_9BURK|nr:hypothetical protein LMG23994_00312 [Cupriavidus pinatubonensis]
MGILQGVFLRLLRVRVPECGHIDPACLPALVLTKEAPIPHGEPRSHTD